MSESTQINNLPLCVDLDGTLVRSDVSLELLVAMLRRAPWRLVSAIRWLIRGKQFLKSKLAEHATINVAHLPYDLGVIRYINDAKQSGREVILVTGSHVSVAEMINAHLDLFDDVLGTDETVNLTGQNKADVLVSRYGTGGFEYIGNDKVDLAIWQHAGVATLVNTSNAVRAAVAALPVEQVELSKPQASTTRLWIRAVRAHQWSKNLLVFLPLLTSHSIFDWEAVTASIIAFFCLSMCASGTYIVNDVLDIEADRQHRSKHRRPFAAGLLSISHGLAVSATLLAVGLLCALVLPWGFQLVLLGYLVTTTVYSWWFKRLAGVDILVLSSLYTLRVIAGALATGISLSFWLLAFSMFLFLSLALVKRVTELVGLDFAEAAENTAPQGREYNTGDLPLLESLGSATGYMAVLVLALYINSPSVFQLYQTPQLLWLLVPVQLYWTTRLWLLTHRGEIHDDPVVFAIKDRSTWIMAALVGVILLAATK